MRKHFPPFFLQRTVSPPFMMNRVIVFFSGFFLLLNISISVEAQLAKDNCKFLGNVVSASVPSDFSSYWNQVTPENSGKWASVEESKDVMTWDQLDVAYQFAQTKNYSFKQHTLVWGQQQPTWIDALSNEEKKAEVEEWIQSFGARYPDVDFIDVVNEPLHAVPTYASALGGNGETGWDWVIWAFEKARQYCPNAKLVLNDYNIINSSTATAQYLKIINLLKERNLIDYIGEQGHFLETTPLQTIKDNLDKLHETGIPILISEYDVHISSDTEQKNKYQEQFPILWSHPGVKGITLWGYKENQIWRTDAYLVRANGTARPALSWLTTYIAETNGESFCLVTGIESGNEANVDIYPNPSQGQITISALDGISDIEIRDMQGRLIERIHPTSSNTILNLQVSPGLYSVRLQNTHGSSFRRIIVR
jgi:endo-1,4-beta-xylanase